MAMGKTDEGGAGKLDGTPTGRGTVGGGGGNVSVGGGHGKVSLGAGIKIGSGRVVSC